MSALETTRRTLLAAALAFSAFPAWAGDGPALRIGWVSALANAPVVIADKKGFFAEEGLAVEVRPFGDGPVIQQAVAAGEIDVAYVGAPPVYQWAARGLDSFILAKASYGQAALVASATSPIRSLADLKGRRLAGVNRGSGMDVLLRAYVLKEVAKLDPETDLQLSNMPVANMNAALDTGAVDAVFEWEPFVSQSVLRGAGRVVFDVNAALPHYPWYVVATTRKVAAARPTDLVKLLRAHRKAIAFLNDHPDEANRILAAEFKLGDVTTTAGATVTGTDIVAEARKRLGWSDAIEDTDRAFVQRLMDYSLALGILSAPQKADDVIDTALWAQATGSGE